MIPKDIVQQICDESKTNAGWEQPDDFAIQILEPTLLIDVGKFKAGTKVGCVSINFADGIVEVFDLNDDSGVSKAAMALKVTLEPITES